MRVLVVDDSRSSLAVLAQIVSRLEAVEIEAFLRPIEALKRSEEVQFDLVVVDHIMPEMDGMEVTRRLRSREAYRLVPIIWVTADGDKALRLHAIEAGATDFVIKPFDATELQARVRNLLALRQAQIELADRAQGLARK